MGRDKNRFEFHEHEWETMKDLFLNRCVKCGADEPLQADHVIPYSKGGGLGINNIQPLCKTCNSGKGNRSSLDYRFVFYGKFRDTYEMIQDLDFLRSRIRILLSLIDPHRQITKEQAEDLIIGWELKGKQKNLVMKEFREWSGI